MSNTFWFLIKETYLQLSLNVCTCVIRNKFLWHMQQKIVQKKILGWDTVLHRKSEKSVLKNQLKFTEKRSQYQYVNLCRILHVKNVSLITNVEIFKDIYRCVPFIKIKVQITSHHPDHPSLCYSKRKRNKNPENIIINKQKIN